MAVKDSLILYHKYQEHFELLPLEEVGRIVMAIIAYDRDGIAPEFDHPATAMAFSFIRRDLDENRAKWEKTCERNQRNGTNGGRPSKASASDEPSGKPDGLITNRENPVGFLGYSENPSEPKKPDHEHEHEHEHDHDHDAELESAEYTSKPLLASSSTSELDFDRDNVTFIDLPLKDGSAYPVTEKQIQHWEELYPAVDVRQQFREMLGWLESHPKNRKTKRGLPAFITGWLARNQNKSRAAPQPAKKQEAWEAIFDDKGRGP
jgi:hypothetical protein